MTKAAKAMKRAWEIVKKAVAEYGGKAMDWMAEALRMAWAELRAPKAAIDRVEEFEELGFKRWQKAGFDRMYISARELGLVCEYYNTGNIYKAWFNGELISNCRARKLKAAKTYIDLKTGKVYSTVGQLGAMAATITGLMMA